MAGAHGSWDRSTEWRREEEHMMRTQATSNARPLASLGGQGLGGPVKKDRAEDPIQATLPKIQSLARGIASSVRVDLSAVPPEDREAATALVREAAREFTDFHQLVRHLGALGIEVG